MLSDMAKSWGNSGIDVRKVDDQLSEQPQGLPVIHWRLADMLGRKDARSTFRRLPKARSSKFVTKVPLAHPGCVPSKSRLEVGLRWKL